MAPAVGGVAHGVVNAVTIKGFSFFSPRLWKKNMVCPVVIKSPTKFCTFDFYSNSLISAANLKMEDIIRFAMVSSCSKWVDLWADQSLGGQFACAPMYYGVFLAIVPYVALLNSAKRASKQPIAIKLWNNSLTIWYGASLGDSLCNTSKT